MATSCPTTSNGKKLGLSDYFWSLTVAALANDVPTPKLELFFDGFRAFSLQAEDEEFILVDFEDLAEPGCESKRHFSLVMEDDDALSSTGHVFAETFAGSRASVDVVIARIKDFFDASSAKMFDATVTRAVVSYDGFSYTADRRYVNIAQTLGSATECALNKSERTVLLEFAGDATLSWLRAFSHWLATR